MEKNQLRILMIDDDPSDLFFVRLALKKADYPDPIAELQDGAAGVEFFRSIEHTPETWPHVVIMDIKMPRMDGDEVLRWLRDHRLYREMPVIMLSSSDEMSDITKTTRLGVMSFLTKEVHCDSLVATLDRFVALKSV